MQDILHLVGALKRPRLLLKAARNGLPHYRRQRHLARLLGDGIPPAPGQVAMQLLCLEQELDGARRAGAASYSPAAHVEILIALMSEATALARAMAQEKASATSALRRATYSLSASEMAGSSAGAS